MIPTETTSDLQHMALTALTGTDPTLRFGVKVQAVAMLRGLTRDDPHPPTVREMVDAVEWAMWQDQKGCPC